MAEETKSTDTDTACILHSLQSQIDRLETVNKELEEKLLKQNENIDRLLDKLCPSKHHHAVVPVVNPEREQLLLEEEDLEINQEDKNKLTTDKSIHSLPLIYEKQLLTDAFELCRYLSRKRIILPVVSATTYTLDVILSISLYYPDDDKEKNYAGLISSILLLFYYLHYDVKINLTHPRLYIVYQFVVWFFIVGGDIIYIYYYQQLLRRPFMACVFVCYAIIDTVWISVLGYLKFQGRQQHMYVITIESLFHFLAMLAQLLIIFIPIFGSHEMLTTNSMAFCILFEFFAHSYTDMLKLKYSKLSRLCLWLMIIFSTLATGLEYFVYAFEQLAEEKCKEGHITENSLLTCGGEYASNARYFIMARETSELSAAIACYCLVILQFFMKKEQKNK